MLIRSLDLSFPNPVPKTGSALSRTVLLIPPLSLLLVLLVVGSLPLFGDC